MSSTAHNPPLKNESNNGSGNGIFCTAAVSPEPVVAFVSFQRQITEFPPTIKCQFKDLSPHIRLRDFSGNSAICATSATLATFDPEMGNLIIHN